MTWYVIILLVAGGLMAGFLLGVRYCVRHMLPQVFARLSPREVARVVNEAGKIKGLNEPLE